MVKFIKVTVLNTNFWETKVKSRTPMFINLDRVMEIYELSFAISGVIFTAVHTCGWQGRRIIVAEPMLYFDSVATTTDPS